METKYISTTDTAKIIRKVLKEAFPRVKFLVRSKVYAGGSSINVSWTDGPAKDQVKAMIQKFEGATFDGMADYKDYVYCRINGERVHFCPDFIFAVRDCSIAAYNVALQDVCIKARIPLITIDDIARSGQNKWLEHIPSLGDDLGSLTQKELNRLSFCSTRYSATFAEYFPDFYNKKAA